MASFQKCKNILDVPFKMTSDKTPIDFIYVPKFVLELRLLSIPHYTPFNTNNYLIKIKISMILGGDARYFQDIKLLPHQLLHFFK